MESQPVIDLSDSVAIGGGGGLGTLVLEQDPVEAATAAAAAPPLEIAPGALRLWAWRAVVALAVLLVAAGLLAFASTPPT